VVVVFPYACKRVTPDISSILGFRLLQLGGGRFAHIKDRVIESWLHWREQQRRGCSLSLCMQTCNTRHKLHFRIPIVTVRWWKIRSHQGSCHRKLVTLERATERDTLRTRLIEEGTKICNNSSA
jgi:hypothetical protein